MREEEVFDIEWGVCVCGVVINESDCIPKMTVEVFI